MRKILFVARFLGVVIASFVSAYFISAFIGSPPASSADFAAWAGAAGTVGALIGTIVLATAQNREKKSAELSLAALVAAGVLPAISSALERSEKVATELEDDIRMYITSNYSRYLLILERTCPWTAQTIVPLSVLPGFAAYHLEHARAQISSAMEDLKFASTIGPDDVPMEPSEYCKSVVVALRDAHMSLTIAKVECAAITPNHVETPELAR